ncbi:MAG: hypothetical protein HZA04_06280 [Nitrospinae bacterium]|nr:hypothetical protein [Nitrospinota bacterium]
MTGPEILDLMDRVKKMEPVLIPKPLKREIEKRAKRAKVSVEQYLTVLLDVKTRPAKAGKGA